MCDEMKVEDEEERVRRIKRRLEEELKKREELREKRKALMPMYRNLPDFVDMNHDNPTFLKDKNVTTTKGVLTEAH